MSADDRDSLRKELTPIIEPLAALVFSADEAYAIYEQIGLHARAIEQHNFGICLGAIQVSLANTYLLALTKLYERQGSRYPLRSIPAALQYLTENVARLPILERPNLLRAMRALDATMGLHLFSDCAPDPREVLQRFQDRLPSLERVDSCELSRTLSALRAHRDKRIAHPEAILPASLPTASWNDARQLLNYAKCFLGIVGWAFMATVYVSSEGVYLLESDARMRGRCMARLLRKAGLSDDGTMELGGARQ